MDPIAKLFYFSSLFFLFSFQASGQVSADTALANRIYQQARNHFNAIKLDSAYQGYEAAGKIYETAQLWEQYLKSRNFMARCQMRQGKFREAISLADSAKERVKPFLSEINEETGNTYNLLGVAHNFLEQEADAVPYLLRAMEIRKEVFGPEHEETLSIYVNLGASYMDLGREDEAMDLYEEMVEILERTGQTEGVAIGGGYYGLALLHDRRWNYDQALYFYEKVQKIWGNIYGINHPKMGEVYIALGSTYGQIEEFELSETSFQKALNLYLTHLGENNLRVCLTLFNLGVLYEKMGNYSQALSYHQRAIEIRKNIYGSDHFSLGSNYNSIGNAYKALGNEELALKNYIKAVELSKNSPSTAGRTQYYALNNLGHIQEKQKNYDQALDFYRLSLAVLDSTNGALAPLGADIMENMGTCFLQIERYDSAEYYFQKGVEIIETFAEVNRVNLDQLLMDSYYGLGSMYFYRFEKSSHSTEDLNASSQAFAKSLQLAENLRKEFLTPDGRQTFVGTTLNTLESSNQTNYALLKEGKADSLALFNQIFHNMEKGKSFSLFESLNDQRAKILGGVPESLVAREAQLKKSISQLEEKIYKEQGKEELADSMAVLSLEAEIFDHKKEFQQLISQIERNYPQYIELKYGGNLPRIEQIQDFLGEEKAIIEFQTGKNGIATMLISSEKTRAFYQPFPDSLAHIITQLRKVLTPDFQQLEDLGINQFVDHAQKLYQILLAQPIAELDDNIHTLIIIPDGILGYIPFDILLSENTDKKNWADLPYLLKKYQISMAYSASILLEGRNTKNPENYFGGFAAEYNDSFVQNDSLSGDSLITMLVRDGQLPLPGAVKEVSEIASLMKGQAFIGKNAREWVFKEKAEDFHILHLAMHALTADQNPLFSRLVFTPANDSLEDNFLYAIELYNMNLAAQMTVLSACNTGLGSIKEGEGVMSLSRAFAYAGVPGLIMSLWSVPDQASSQIMLDFYRGIKEQKAKDKALREAKLNYLSQTKANELAHPFYWAGFVPVGDMHPVRQPVSALMHVGLILLITLFLGGGFAYVNYRKSQS
ncbi:MAG: CHAT domain-containing protein [Bacteroidetes bacterium]|nr:CHAT domain-containing protein [Bacteroidota bacterium]